MKTVVALDLLILPGLVSDQLVLNHSYETSRRRVNVHNKFLAALSLDQKYAESGPDSARIAGFQACKLQGLRCRQTVKTRMSRDNHVSQVGILIMSRLISYEIRYT